MAHAGPRDPWMGDFNAAKLLGDDCFLLLQERNGLLQKSPNDSGVFPSALVPRLAAPRHRGACCATHAVPVCECLLTSPALQD